MGIFYKPSDGYAADFIPFFHQGRYHLFYLKDYRDAEKHGEGTPWWHLATSDFVHFEDLGEAIPRGLVGAQDVWVFTGCVIEHTGLFHIFYTGHSFHYPKVGRAQECVMHAASADMKTWRKDEGFAIFAPQGYERDDWRDPFVFWKPDDSEWGMLLAARKTSGPPRQRGCIAYLSSADLKTWRVREPFWQPDLHFTHECPDLFKMGDWWYLLWSEFSDRHVTRYRMSRDLRGPWIAPPDDAFDTRAYYAAKTAGDGEKRFLFGWLATRDGEKDAGNWQWGGSLVVHELRQRGDGTLAVTVPENITAAFRKRLETKKLQPLTGDWSSGDKTIECESPSRFSSALLGEMPAECLLETRITFEAGTQSCGVLLRASADLSKQYQVRLEPVRQRIVIDRWPRPGDQPFIFERPLPLQAGAPVKLACVVNGSELAVYANGETALSCRMYDSSRGAAGLFVSEGSAKFDSPQIRSRD
jgi:beta-fructofuranosidase